MISVIEVPEQQQPSPSVRLEGEGLDIDGIPVYSECIVSRCDDFTLPGVDHLSTSTVSTPGGEGEDERGQESAKQPLSEKH